MTDDTGWNDFGAYSGREGNRDLETSLIGLCNEH
jgi:hypothetical protein